MGYMVGENYLHLHYSALEMAPGQASGEGPAMWFFGLAPTSGPDQLLYIWQLGLGVGTLVDVSLIAFVRLCVGDGARSCVCRRTC